MGNQSQHPPEQQFIDSGQFQHLKVKKIPRLLGVGVFTTATFHRGQLIVRYAGETIAVEEGERRRKLHEEESMKSICACFAVC